MMKPAEAQAELQRKSQQMLDMYQKIATYQAQLQQLKATVPVVPPTSVAARQSAAQVEQARKLAATAQPQMEEMRAELDKALKVARTVNSWFEQNAECLHLQDTTNTPAAFLQRNLESCQSRLNVLSANASVAGEVVRVQNAGSQAPFGITPSAIPAPSDQSAYPGPGQPQPAQSVYSPPARPGGQQGQSMYSGSLPPQSDQSVIVGGQQGKSVYSGSLPARLDQSGYGGSQPAQSVYSGSLPPQSDQSAYAGSQPGQSMYSGSLPPQSDQSAYPGSPPGQSVYSGSLPPQSDQSAFAGGQPKQPVYSGSLPARLDKPGYGVSLQTQQEQAIYAGSMPKGATSTPNLLGQPDMQGSSSSPNLGYPQGQSTPVQGVPVPAVQTQPAAQPAAMMDPLTQALPPMWVRDPDDD